MTATTTTEMHLVPVPYAKLVPGKKVNARRSGGDEGIDELAALIRAKGLIQPLVVRPAKADKFEIMAGRRRYTAIGRLIKLGDWPKDQEVPCVIRDETDSDARETSAVENIGRLAMHPVDEFEHFADLATQGKSDTEIAQRYGIPERRVRQRRALGALVPEIRDAWRSGRIDADTAQAFTLTTNQQEQRAVFHRLDEDGRASEWSVRRELAPGDVKTDDDRFQLVGRDAYEAAGGTIREDLFAEHSYVEHPGLLDGLVKDKLAAECQRLVDDGWAWAELRDKLPRDWHGWSRLREPKLDLTAEEVKRLDAIEARLKAILDTDRDPLSIDDDEALDAESERLEIEQKEIENRGLERAYAVKDKAKAGCVVALDWRNAIEIVYGVKRPTGDTQVDLEDSIDNAGSRGDDAPDKAAKSPFDVSAPVVEAITRARTEAAAKVLETEPDLALKCIVAALESSFGPVDISVGGNAHGRGQLPRAEFKKRLVKATALGREVLLGELAHWVAKSLDLVVRFRSGSANPYENSAPAGSVELLALLPGAEYLEAARAAFPAGDYFGRAGKATALKALEEMLKAGCLTQGDLPGPNARKGDIAHLAAEQAATHGWLPPEMRHPDYCIGNQKPKAKRAARKEAA